VGGDEGLDSSSKGRPPIRASFTWGGLEPVGLYNNTWILEYSSSIANSKEFMEHIGFGID
jgi:hypothetical protein